MTTVAPQERYDDGIERLALWSGPAAVAVSAMGIVAATLIAPWFTWTGNALSDLGAAGVVTAQLFNGTLMITGALGLAFAMALFRETSQFHRRLGTVCVAASMPMLALVGVFALPSPLHGPVAVAFFLLFTVGILLDGVGTIRTGSRRLGAGFVALSLVHVLGWILWALIQLDGVAIPEMVGTLVLWLWVGRRYRGALEDAA